METNTNSSKNKAETRKNFNYYDGFATPLDASIDDIKRELRLKYPNPKLCTDTEFDYGVFNVRYARNVIDEAAKLPTPRSLYRNMWYEGELCCLFADSNLGKSILAMQIAHDVTQRLETNVLYIDFELDNKQFQMRYTDPDGTHMRFSYQLFRATIDSNKAKWADTDTILTILEDMIKEDGFRIIIIDNLAALCATVCTSSQAAALMNRLMLIKKRYNASILTIAHTPKRNLTAPITANDLAGNKILFNFFDSAFAIGRNLNDPKLRYIKQIKCRWGEFKHDEGNVIVCDIQQDPDGFVHFNELGTSTEAEQLHRVKETQEDPQLQAQIQQLQSQGKSYREIARELGTTFYQVQKLARHLNQSPTPSDTPVNQSITDTPADTPTAPSVPTVPIVPIDNPSNNPDDSHSSINQSPSVCPVPAVSTAGNLPCDASDSSDNQSPQATPPLKSINQSPQIKSVQSV